MNILLYIDNKSLFPKQKFHRKLISIDPFFRKEKYFQQKNMVNKTEQG